MNIDNLKLHRLHIYLENSSMDKLEEFYFACFNEFPLESLTVEDLQFNISGYLDTCKSDDISRVFKYIF